MKKNQDRKSDIAFKNNHEKAFGKKCLLFLA